MQGNASPPTPTSLVLMLALHYPLCMYDITTTLLMTALLLGGSGLIIKLLSRGQQSPPTPKLVPGLDNFLKLNTFEAEPDGEDFEEWMQWGDSKALGATGITETRQERRARERRAS